MGRGPGQFLLAVARDRRACGHGIAGDRVLAVRLRAARDAGLAAAQRSDRHQRQTRAVDGLRHIRDGRRHRRRAVRLPERKRLPDSLGISLSVDALVMVLLGGVETVSGAVIGAIVYKALNIWLVSRTDLSKLILGAVIVLIVVAFPKGIVGMWEALRGRRPQSISAVLKSRVETAE